MRTRSRSIPAPTAVGGLGTKLALLLLLAAGCGPKAGTTGGSSGGGSESAPTQPPDEMTAKAEEANTAGKLAEAAELWRKSIEVVPEDKRHSLRAWRDVEQNLSALEYFADSAMTEERPGDAVAAYAVLTLVQPDNAALVEKNNTAKKQYAVTLAQAADDEYHRQHPGAALATELEALALDPLQRRAFESAAELKRLLRKHSKVEVSPKIEDSGYKPLATILQVKLSPALDNYPPYGKAQSPITANLRVVIEAYDKNELSEDGTDELPQDLPQPTIPIPNPAVTELQKRIERKKTELADLKKQLKDALAAKKGKKKPPTAGGKTEDPGLGLARQIDKTRVDIASYEARLQQLPATVPPPPLPATWKLPWTKTTRTVHARVRFELVEQPEYAESITIESEQKVEKSDKTHKGNAEHHVEPKPLNLPSWDDLNTQLAEAIVAEGVPVLDKGKARRVQTLIDRGHTMQTAGDKEQATDAYVALLYLVGSEKIPDDVNHYLVGVVPGGHPTDLLDNQATQQQPPPAP